MSASIRPTRAPDCASATERLTATVDLPTPPFPLLTAITYLTPGTIFSGACPGVPGFLSATQISLPFRTCSRAERCAIDLHTAQHTASVFSETSQPIGE